MTRLRVVSDNSNTPEFRSDPADIGSPRTRLVQAMRQTAVDLSDIAAAKIDYDFYRNLAQSIGTFVFDTVGVDRHGLDIARKRKELEQEDTGFASMCETLGLSTEEDWRRNPVHYGALALVFGERVAAAAFFAQPNLA